MNGLANNIKDFIEKKITLNAYSLPWNYPKLSDFEQFQAGYRYNAITQEDVTGYEEGDFHPNWYVICSNYFDDPFFVDITEIEQNYPVYYSQHGGDWVPTKVADSITTFMVILSKLKELESDEEALLEYLAENCDLENVLWQEVYQEYQEEDDDE